MRILIAALFILIINDVKHVAEDIKAETMKAFFEGKVLKDAEDIESFFDEIYRYIKKNDSFFRLVFISDEVTNFVHHLGNICKDRIYKALRDDKTIKDRYLLELEISTFSDGLDMQFIHYYHSDYDVTLEEIIECGKLLRPYDDREAKQSLEPKLLRFG